MRYGLVMLARHWKLLRCKEYAGVLRHPFAYPVFLKLGRPDPMV